MAYIQSLEKQYLTIQPVGSDLGLPRGDAYSSYFAPYETQTPSYTVPNAYSSAQAGLRTNEFAYSLITRRATAVSNARLCMYEKNKRGDSKKVDDHPILEFLENLNDLIQEPSFWAISEMSRCVGGFGAWEIEGTMIGKPKKLWYINPTYCSFLRGDKQMFRAIRYQPYGMQPYDIPAERIVILRPQNFDPLYPLLRWLSPSALCFPQLRVDTAMTQFLQDFISHGARTSGLISVAQTLDDDTANEIRDRWIKQHGGTSNWNAPVVMGDKTTYVPMQMNFSDMTFPELDARTETRMCDAFQVPTIVADARAGLEVASYNNQIEAHKSWHRKWVIPTWENYARQFQKKMFPLFDIDDKKYYLAFDTSAVYDLQEDIVKKNEMWGTMASKNVLTRDEVRRAMGFDPIDNEPVFVGMTIRQNVATPTPQTMGLYSTPQFQTTETPTDNPDFVKLEELTKGKQPLPNSTQTPAPVSGSVTETGTATEPEHVDKVLHGAPDARVVKEEENKPKRDEEKKAFTKFAKARVREGKRLEIGMFEFKYHTLDEITTMMQPYLDGGAGEMLDTINRGLEMLEKRG